MSMLGKLGIKHTEVGEGRKNDHESISAQCQMVALRKPILYFALSYFTIR